MTGPAADVVIPSLGRPSLAVLLDTLLAQPLPGRVFVVYDRPGAGTLPALPSADERVQVLAGRGWGPAAARNAGWRASRADWVAFLDDDVIVDSRWAEDLAGDLEGAGDQVAAVQGQVEVPLPQHRRPTDWERNVAGLETSRWITADLAVRRRALVEVGGFDERFPRAYREDADLALRLADRGLDLAMGRRRVRHPVPPASWSVSLAKQRGNADDALMGRLHGRHWRPAAGAPSGALRRHAAVTAAGLAAGVSAAAGRRRLAAAGGLAWSGGDAPAGEAGASPPDHGPRPRWPPWS